MYIYFCSGGGVYNLDFCNYNYNGDTKFEKYAFVSGLKNHEVAYVTQASENEEREGIEIKIKGTTSITIKAHVLRDNHHHIEDKLYVGFTKSSPQIHLRDSQEVTVSFLLKTSYFHSLQKSVRHLPDDVTLRILPKGHQCTRKEEDICYDNALKQLYDLDDEQFRALSLILAKRCPNELPTLIDGPFGTGKTYVLAAAANALFRSNDSTRILVCTQQQKSAENFLEIFTTKLVAIFNDRANKILLKDYGTCSATIKHFLVRSRELKLKLHSATDKLLVVTTCLTAHYLQDISFTHIFIDEGAQMREPEAIAALRMANKDTKIVIAGDHHQVKLRCYNCVNNFRVDQRNSIYTKLPYQHNHIRILLTYTLTDDACLILHVLNLFPGMHFNTQSYSVLLHLHSVGWSSNVSFR